MKNSCLFHFLLLAVFLLSQSCSGPAQPDADKGGDHLPDLKDFQMDDLPDSAVTGAPIMPKEVDSSSLRRFVNASDNYNICQLDTEADSAQVAALQSFVSNAEGKVSGYGVEGIVNFALSEVSQFIPNVPKFSKRISINAVFADSTHCQLLLLTRKETEFPFTNPLYLADKTMLFYAGQIYTQAGKRNVIPVGFVRATTDALEMRIRQQYLISTYLGLGESTVDGSWLNVETDSSTVKAQWAVVDSRERPVLKQDGIILFQFAALYQKLLSASDLTAFQYYQDRITGTSIPTDPDLVLPTALSPIAFQTVVGNSFVTGVRLVSGIVPVCVFNNIGIPVSDAQISQNFGMLDPGYARSLPAILHSLESTFSVSVKIVKEGCALAVVFKNADQYPFSTNALNGMYAAEGSVKASDASATSIPVIYLNLSNLSPDVSAVGGKKYAAYDLEHEFAHFLGFRHSTSTTSILSPAGVNTDWDTAGSDTEMFLAFLKKWKVLTNAK